MDLINQTIRDYKVISKIGEGGMGEVYLAEDTMLGRKVAIKALNPALTKEPSFTERFRQEARVQATLQHANIISLYAFIAEDDNYYMVMELATGVTLKEEIRRRGPLPFARVKKILLQALEALSYAHQRGIVHRDIKPSNIMIGEDDQIKIMDFGIAKILSDASKTRTGSMVGSVHYMSPEQIRGDKDIDQRTDIYSLGMTLYEMLSGRSPFDDSTTSEFAVMTSIVEGKIPDPREVYPYIPDDMIALYYRMIAKEREERYRSCGEAAAQLKKYDEPEKQPPIVAPAETAVAHRPADDTLQPGSGTFTNLTERKKSRSPLVFGVVVLAIIASVLFFVFVIVPPDKKIEKLITENSLAEAQTELDESRLTPEQKSNYDKIISAYNHEGEKEYFAALSEISTVNISTLRTEELKRKLEDFRSSLESRTSSLSSSVNGFLTSYSNSLAQNNLNYHMSLFCDEAYSFDNNMRSRSAITASKKKFFTSYTTTQHKFKILSVENKGDNILAVTADERHWTTKLSDNTMRLEWVKKYFELKDNGRGYKVFREYNPDTYLKVSPVEAVYNGYTFKKSGSSFEDTKLVIKNSAGSVEYTENVPQAEFLAEDYDNDSDIELLILKYSGGAHCCNSIVIYELNGTFVKSSNELELGDALFDFTDADGDGDKEFVSANKSYAYAFTSFAYSFFPPLVYEYTNNTFYDRTTNYPATVRNDLTRMQEETNKFLNELSYSKDCNSMAENGWGDDYRSLIAALVTDIYLLEGETKAYEELKNRYPCDDQYEYWGKIKELLATYGKSH